MKNVTSWSRGIVRWLFVAILATGLATPALAGEKYAFLVAVKQYNKAELTSLEYTENDIVRLAEVLRDSGYVDANIVLMTQSLGAREARFAPFSRNIVDELNLVLDELTEDDSIVVAFAGHGIQFRGDQDAYFCPADARLKDRDTLVSLGNVYKSLQKCQAGTKVLFVDACRNDPQSRLSRSAGEVELEAVGRPQKVQPPGGVAAFFSCSAGQKAFEHPDLQHGVFFHFVAEGLSGQADMDGDLEITLTELEQFAVKQVQRYVRTELGMKQTPERRGEARGLLTLAAVRRLAAPAPPAPPAPPVPAPSPNPMPNPAPVADLAGYDGRWLNAATNSTYNISLPFGKPVLSSIVDDSGEEFPVWFSYFDDASGSLYWKYKVRTTGHIVEELVRLQADGSLSGEWISTDPTGTQQRGSDTWQRTGGSVATEVWRGQWLAGSTNSMYHIRVVDGRPTLNSVIDDDGEVYNVSESSWDGASLHLKYHVPSTGYTVEETLRQDTPDSLTGNWTSTNPSGQATTGSDTWKRNDAHRLDGAWVADSTKSTYTIKADEGRPELVSIVDDDGEVYTIQSFTWNGLTMRWKYHVPSTNYTVEESITAFDDENTLSGNWTSIPPAGDSTTGSDKFRRNGAPPPSTTSPVIGQWIDDSTRVTVTVQDTGSGIQAISAVDDDGEVFEIQSSSFDGTTLTTTYKVPSTGYVLTESLQLNDANDALVGNGFAITPGGTRNEFSTRWSRATSAAPTAPPVADNSAWNGDWFKPSTMTTFTVTVGADGTPRVSSIVDDDGEVFPVQESNWDGATLFCKYLVPSTRYVLDQSMKLQADGSAAGTFTSYPPDSGSFSGDDTWSKK